MSNRLRASMLIVVATLMATVPLAVAQESTPPAGTELAPGVYAEVFTGVPSDRAPGHTLYLARFTFLPGGEIFPHGHPGTTVLSIDSGTLGWTLLEGTAEVIRTAASGATGPNESITTPGVEVLLQPGDAIFYEDDVIHTARGAGDEPAVILATLLLDADAPLLMPADMEMEGTPAS